MKISTFSTFKKNSIRGNYLRKYGKLFVTENKLKQPIFKRVCCQYSLINYHASLDEQIQVEIGSGDEERLLPTDLLNDPEDECINENQNHPQKPVLRKTWSWTPLKGIFLTFPAACFYILDAVTSSGILKAKQKLGVTFNFDKYDVIDLTKISKMTMCRASEANSEKQSQILCFLGKKIIKGCFFIGKLKEI